MKILVVRYRFIGDTILTIPFLRNLRKAYPDATIDMLVGPMSGELIEDCPYVNNVIYFDTTKKHRYENKNTQKKNFWYYVKLLKSNNYDKAYVLKRSLSSAMLTFFAGIKQRIGFNTEHRGLFLTKRVPYTKNRHEVECFLDVLRTDDVEVADNHLENWVNEEAVKVVDKELEKYTIPETKKVLVHATSGNVKKQWSNKNFAELIEYLSNTKGYQCFFVGAKSDYSVYDAILSLINTDLKIKPINLCGNFSLQESNALISKMDFAVGSDSGTLHLAAAFNIPVIGIYGPMNNIKWRAFGDKHIPLFSKLDCVPCELSGKCKRNMQCLKDISSEIVIEAINKL